MHQAEAAALFGLSQSAYSRLENGDTKRWTPKARAGAAKLLGTTTDNIEALLDGADMSNESLNELGERLEQIAADTADNRTMLLEILATTSAGSEEFGVMVRSTRMSRGWTLFDAASLIGISPATLQRIEEGAAAILMYADPLAGFLGIDAAAIRMYFDAQSNEDFQITLAAMRLRVEQATVDEAVGSDSATAIEQNLANMSHGVKEDAE